jgi:ABC-type transport system substrate-binding protein
VRTIYHGEAEPANQWIYKGHWAYNPAVHGYPYNPARAKSESTLMD